MPEYTNSSMIMALRQTLIQLPMRKTPQRLDEYAAKFVDISRPLPAWKLVGPEQVMPGVTVFCPGGDAEYCPWSSEEEEEETEEEVDKEVELQRFLESDDGKRWSELPLQKKHALVVIFEMWEAAWGKPAKLSLPAWEFFYDDPGRFPIYLIVQGGPFSTAQTTMTVVRQVADGWRPHQQGFMNLWEHNVKTYGRPHVVSVMCTEYETRKLRAYARDKLSGILSPHEIRKLDPDALCAFLRTSANVPPPPPMSDMQRREWVMNAPSIDIRDKCPWLKKFSVLRPYSAEEKTMFFPTFSTLRAYLSNYGIPGVYDLNNTEQCQVAQRILPDLSDIRASKNALRDMPAFNRHAAHKYTYAYAFRLNKAMRFQKPPKPGHIDFIRQLRGAIDKAPRLSKGVYMWRGLRDDEFLRLQKTYRAGALKEIVDTAFSSFSYDPSVSIGFAGAGKMQHRNAKTMKYTAKGGPEFPWREYVHRPFCCLLKCWIPEGTKGLFLESVSGIPAQREWITYPGAVLKVKKIQPKRTMFWTQYGTNSVGATARVDVIECTLDSYVEAWDEHFIREQRGALEALGVKETSLKRKREVEKPAPQKKPKIAKRSVSALWGVDPEPFIMTPMRRKILNIMCRNKRGTLHMRSLREIAALLEIPGYEEMQKPELCHEISEAMVIPAKEDDMEED